jgi:hypothetical protein
VMLTYDECCLFYCYAECQQAEDHYTVYYCAVYCYSVYYYAVYHNAECHMLSVVAP